MSLSSSKLPSSHRIPGSWLSIAGLSILVAATAPTACGVKEDASNPGGDPSATTGDGGSPPVFGTPSDAGNSVTDGGKCQSLNIGILGVPGENASANFQDWLQKAGTTANRVQTEDDDVITSEVLAPFDVVVIDHLMHDVSDAEATAFQTWLSSGKGAMSMTGYLNAPEVDFRANRLIAKVGLEYVTPRFDGPITEFIAHPITQGITEISFFGGYPIHEIDGTSATRTAIASNTHGKAGYVAELAQGRAFVWGDEWIEFDTEWTTLPQVQQFWVQIFGWLAPNRCALTPQPR